MEITQVEIISHFGLVARKEKGIQLLPCCESTGQVPDLGAAQVHPQALALTPDLHPHSGSGHIEGRYRLEAVALGFLAFLPAFVLAETQFLSALFLGMKQQVKAKSRSAYSQF